MRRRDLIRFPNPARKGSDEPDGYAAGGDAQVISLGMANYAVGDTPVFSKITGSGKASLVAISPAGKYVMNVVRDGGLESLWLRNLPSNSNTQVVPPAELTYAHLRFSPDGNYLYFTRSEPDSEELQYLYRAPVLGGTPERLVTDIDSNITFQGVPVTSLKEFREALLSQGDEVVRTVSEKLLTYALGRGLTYHDAPLVRQLVRTLRENEYRWSSLVTGIIKSYQFQMRTAPEPATATASQPN